MEKAVACGLVLRLQHFTANGQFVNFLILRPVDEGDLKLFVCFLCEPTTV